MPKATRSVEEVEEVREKILDRALELLVKEGFESLSMGKLGAKMKMTGANLYNYYANKDELLIAIHKKSFQMIHDKIRTAVSNASAPRDRLAALAKAFVEFGTEHVNIYDIMFNRPIRQYSDYIGTPQEKMSYEEYHNSIKALVFAVTVVRDFIETRPELSTSDPKFLTIKFLSALHGIISLNNSGILKEMDDNPDLVMDAIIESTIRSLTD
ncbi:MAG TPA: TetR/AcrR family transcriptional regulator [Spirochaetota bacterium]|nr:TetR/AcrR family transcriptional regulator [Spirochaetota bacterium]HPC42644.1 TetR/AcrR family transcriptional regulator [Spirochaetota bacterium]HPL16261.1 TetR/AcrR family transcriptional regulator [Spirochaetota bacterium]HQF08436.1 TetR/AcrR family transcriptional regulator [Spirochaetota bacterium]HQH99074.1 TetR/AcrR family transcriptional regulator [Spirochaetota bacterium]